MAFQYFLVTLKEGLEICEKIVFLTGRIVVKSKHVSRHSIGWKRCFESLKVTNSILILKVSHFDSHWAIFWLHFLVRYYISFMKFVCYMTSLISHDELLNKEYILRKQMLKLCVKWLHQWTYREQNADCVMLNYLSPQFRKFLLSAVCLIPLSLTENQYQGTSRYQIKNEGADLGRTVRNLGRLFVEVPMLYIWWILLPCGWETLFFSFLQDCGMYCMYITSLFHRSASSLFCN